MVKTITHRGQKVRVVRKRQRAAVIKVRDELHVWAKYWIERRAEELGISPDKFRELLRK